MTRLNAPETLLEVRDLSIRYLPTRGKPVNATCAVHLDIRPTEVSGIIGESGSGKSTLAAAVLGLLPANAECLSGVVSFEGQDLLRLSKGKLRKLRGARIALISQDPATALNPVVKIGTQISEVLRAHLALSRRERKERVLELLQEVGFDSPQRICSAYAHELSGGQRQRVVIAQAVACRPSLIIADEPTSKLDSTLQAEILALLANFVRKNRAALILITHDPALLAGFADRIAVMYAGRVVEEGSAAEILSAPAHPYTQALLRLAGIEREDPPANAGNLQTISGDPPDLTETRAGCRFEPRCPERMAVCANTDPQATMLNPSHCVNCFKYVH